MLLEAHWHGFRVFGGILEQGIYENMRTAVDGVGREKKRQVNMRALSMANHDVFEPVFCNPAIGWEKGQVEKNVQNARHRLYHLMPRFPDLAALNVGLNSAVSRYGRDPARISLPGSVTDVRAAEQAALMPLPPAAHGFVENEPSGCPRPD